MSNKTTYHIFALLRQEWLNWVASGHIRFHSKRIYTLKGTEDYQGFSKLMSNSPDETWFDAGGYILASIPFHRKNKKFVKSVPVKERVEEWIPIDAVQQFYPLSELGARSLQGDASRAHVKLGQPIFQKLWEAWCEEQREIRANWRGELFVETLDYDVPHLDTIPESVLPYLRLEEETPSEKKDSAYTIRGTRAYAWAAAFSLLDLLLGQLPVDKEPLNAVIRKTKQEYDLTRPILGDPDFSVLTDALDKAVADKYSASITISFLVVVFHYCGQIMAEKAPNMVSLKQDLAALVCNGDTRLAASAAYFIGRAMEDIPVTMLAYAKTPKAYPALHCVLPEQEQTIPRAD